MKGVNNLSIKSMNWEKQCAESLSLASDTIRLLMDWEQANELDLDVSDEKTEIEKNLSRLKQDKERLEEQLSAVESSLDL